MLPPFVSGLDEGLETMDINELLASARLAEDEVPICLRPDLLAQYKAAVTALENAEQEQKRNGSLAGGGKTAAQATLDELRGQMLAASLTFTVRALPQKRWGQLYGEHPPRESDEGDARTGFNRDTFYEALVRECVVDPQMTGEQWDALLAHLSTAQYATLKTTAMQVNSSDVDVPFLLAASRAPTSIEPASERPEGSESLSSDSTAGNPASPSSTTKRAASSGRAKKSSGTASSKT